jgi:hypothetical protein
MSSFQFCILLAVTRKRDLLLNETVMYTFVTSKYSRNSAAFPSVYLREIIFTKFINTSGMQQGDVQDKDDSASLLCERTCGSINCHSYTPDS